MCVKNGVFFRDFLQLNGIFCQIFLPTIFLVQMCQTCHFDANIPPNIPFCKRNSIYLSQQRGVGGILQLFFNMVFSKFPFQALHFQTYPLEKSGIAKLGSGVTAVTPPLLDISSRTNSVRSSSGNAAGVITSRISSSGNAAGVITSRISSAGYKELSK